MRFNARPSCRLLLCAGFTVVAAAAPAWAQTPTPTPTPAQTSPPPQGQPANKVAAPEAELSEARKVEAAADAAARLAAASEFLKKYPKSTARPMVAQLVGAKLDEVTDPAQQIALAENFRTLFNEPGEADTVNSYLLSAYLKANRLDDAFKLAAAAVDKMPNPVFSMIELVIAANDQVRQQNTKYAAQGVQYAGRAIELIETDKRPATVDDEIWAAYKTKELPQLYQLQGFLLLISGDAARAKSQLAKAIELNPTDPQTYWIIGHVRDSEYQDAATKYKAASGPAQAELLKQALALLDLTIDDYAHVVALTEGNPKFQQVHDQALQNLQTYYKYRHNNSLEGLQQLVDKYKQPAAAKP